MIRQRSTLHGVGFWRAGWSTAALALGLLAGPVQASVEPDLLPPRSDRNTVLVQQNQTLLNLPGFEASGPLAQALQRRQGEQILREIHQQMRVLDDPLVSVELQAIVDRLVAVARMPTPMTVLVIDDPTLNAFAVPGSVVAVNSGLILKARSVDELAGVLAHELAHVHQHHFERRMAELRQTRWLVLGGMLAGLAASQADNDVGAAVLTGTQALAIDRQLAYSRGQEQEADRIGLQLLQGAGYAPQALGDFFEVMQKNQGLPSYVPDFVLTHPLTRERISDARQRTAWLDRPAVDPGAQQRFELLQGRVAVLSLQASLTELQARSQRRDPEQVTLALLLARQQRFAEAQQVLQPIVTAHPDWLAAQVALVQTLLAQQQRQPDPVRGTPLWTALAVLTQRWPDQPVTHWLQAQAALQQGQGNAALGLLQALATQFPYQRTYWEALEQAATQTHRPAAEVLRYRAERLNLMGDLPAAVVALERAEKLAQRDADQAALLRTIQRRLQDWREVKGR